MTTEAVGEKTPAVAAVQFALPGLTVQDRRLRQRLRSPKPADPGQLISTFKARLRRRYTEASAEKYVWVLHNLLQLASHLAGRQVSVIKLLADSELLGKVFISGLSGDGSHEISAYQASQRRSVMRSFALLMARELAVEGAEDAEEMINKALRDVAEPVGCGFRLPVGWPRGRGGPMPTEEEAFAIQKALRSRPGWIGARNAALVGILTARGQRIGALLRLDGANLHKLPEGSVRMLLHAKSSHEPFELTLPTKVAIELEAYLAMFNAWAKACGRQDRVGFGLSGPIWRSESGVALSYREWSRELTDACQQAGAQRFTSHAFRRSFASRGTELLPRTLVALAGNWTSPRRMDDHYVQPSVTRLQQQLSTLSPAPHELAQPEPLELAGVH